MLFVPLPFVVALLLLILLVQIIRRNEGTGSNPFFVALISGYALQSVVIGLRWGYDLTVLLPVQATLAAVIATFAWLSFEGLRSEQRFSKRPVLLLHMLPALIIIGFVAFWPAPISLALIVIFLGYGIALTRLALAGTDALGASRLDGATGSYRALQITAFAILGSAVTDLVISLDFAETGGVYSARLVAIGNVIALLVLGAGAAIADASQTAAEDAGDGEPRSASNTASPEDSEVAAAVDMLIRSRALYQDVDLNLNRLARKMGLSARQVSGAINRVKAMSVSQYVNDFRVKEACRLLANTDQPVTSIMFESGFQTKSNFNREFLRVTGMSPKAWRARHTATNAGDGLRLVS